MTDNPHTITSLAPARRIRAPLPAVGLLALLCVAVLAPAAHAEPDIFGLGNGQDNARTINTGTNTVINAYAQVTATVPAGQSFIPVGATTGFEANDLVLVIQNTGLTPAPASGDQTPINMAGNTLGHWELARVQSVAGSQLNLSRPLTQSFPGTYSQVVMVPEYTTLTIDGTSSLVARAWDGATGGVLAFMATGAVTNDGTISASGRGFRGGIFLNSSRGDGCVGLDAKWPDGAMKGEGVVPGNYAPTLNPFPPPAGTTGYGNVANAGGGGICHNSGGGGGGGAGAGGKGGRTWSGESAPSRDVGGRGGVMMTYDPTRRGLFGGGGGAGHSNDDVGGMGNAGGGIVFMRAASLAGAGVVTADGVAGQDARGDGSDAAGGGGAGGTLYMRFTGALNCNASTVTARGGNGGSSNFASPHGTGGGGGGGHVLLQAATAACTPVVTGGAPGTQPTADATDGPTYGAVAGSPGVVTVLAGAFPSVLAAPVVVTPANGSTTSMRPPITGTAPANSTVILYVDGVEIGRTTADAAGNYTFTPLTDLAVGSHTVNAIAELQGVASPSSNTNTFTVPGLPAPAIVSPTNGAVLTTAPSQITGTATGGATSVVLTLNGVTYPAIPVTGGNWVFPIPFAVADGNYNVSVVAQNGSATSPATTSTFTVDTQTSVAVTTPAEGAVLTNGVVTYTGTAEPGATVTVVVDGQTVGTVTAAANGAWVVTGTTPLADGPHTVTATARDERGNTATDTNAFRVDTATSVAITVPADGGVLNNRLVTYWGTAEPGATVTVVVDGQTVGTTVAAADGRWLVAPATALVDGPHSVTATARDAQGNTATDTHAFTVDTATSVAITTPAEGAVLPNPLVTYTGTAEPGAMVTVVVDGQTVGTVTAATNGSWSIAAATPLANGQHSVTAMARDARGNTATDTNAFTVNTGGLLDSDADGVADTIEIELGLDPNDPDTDDDGVTDGADGLTDTDGDGTIDARDPDSDNDGLLDGTERGVTLANAPAGTNTSSPNFVPDSDPSATTDPKKADTDGDGLKDGAEDVDHNGGVGSTETDPNNADTDGDSLNDGVEVNGSNSTDPLNPDTDADGLDDGREDANRNGGLDNGETDPKNRDTDLGGASDGEEVNGAGDPLNGNDDFVVVGRGCSTGGAGTFAPLALLLLALPLRGRLRRSGARASRALVAGAAGGLALSGALVASPAEAQVTAPTASQAIDVQQYKPGPGTGDILGVHSARVQRHLGWNVGLSLNYADKPLNFMDPRQDRFLAALVRSQVGLDLMGAVGLFDRFELGVVLPVTVQDSEPAPQVDASFSNGVGSGGIGDLRVVPKARLVDGESFDLALAVPVVLPTGGGSDFLGGSGFGVQPRMVAEYGQGLRIAANLGLDFRKQQRLRNLNTGNAFTYGVGAEVPFTVGELPLAAAATVVGALGLEEQDTEERPLELLAALKYRSPGGLAAHVGAGPGLTRGYGTPGFRVLAGLSYSPEPSREPKPVVASAPVDSDGDGLMDPQDRCPVEAEDKDGHADADGCPDPDNDSDGILDGSDKCISVPETKNGHEDADGCPDTEPAPVDSDGDGLVDPKDGCPTQAEDKDGFEDADGCPDPDNDKDGIADTTDKCPAEPEVINGVQDEDGCPDKGKVKVQVDGERILILEKVYFATSKDVILPRSFPLLKQVAAVLRANPQVALLRIEGHTDDQGNDAKNLDLSQRRAANVRKFLVSEGILPVRLEAAGYGETKPVDTNKTAMGRENNRRVEFTILRVSKVEVERDAP